MESRQSGRADGRGWGGRGDSRAGRGRPRDDRTPSSPFEESRPGPAGASPSEEDLLHGPEESPWVRYAAPGARPQESAGRDREGPPLPDLSALLAVLEGMRRMVPPELATQVNALVRELLLTLRALIDWYLERLDGAPREPEVEEIPID